MKRVYRLADTKFDCLTRSQGEQVRAELGAHVEALEEGDRLVIDFTGVDIMSPSFADECIAKLAEQLGPQGFRRMVSLTGANETVKTLVNAVVATRLAASAAQR